MGNTFESISLIPFLTQRMALVLLWAWITWMDQMSANSPPKQCAHLWVILGDLKIRTQSRRRAQVISFFLICSRKLSIIGSLSVKFSTASLFFILSYFSVKQLTSSKQPNTLEKYTMYYFKFLKISSFTFSFQSWSPFSSVIPAQFFRQYIP